MISTKLFNDVFQGFSIIDCAVRSSDAFVFLLRDVKDSSDGKEPRKRLATYFPSGDGKVGWAGYSGFTRARLAVASSPSTQAVIVAADGTVAAQGSGFSGMEPPIARGSDATPLYTSMHALATIGGLVYAVGPWHAVCRRTAPGVWESIAHRSSLPIPRRDEYGSNAEGFNAIGAFGERDIYCGGGKGDLWRFDGVDWHRCNVPTNMIIENICCAGDGTVYLGLQGGSVLRGRVDDWNFIHDGKFSVPFRDMVWFDGCVWCTSDYGIWTIRDGVLEEAAVPNEVRACSGALSAGDGVMLLAGMYGACIYNGSNWTILMHNG
jgi:hypothetical protein